jgi:hypothetical protein
MEKTSAMLLLITPETTLGSTVFKNSCNPSSLGELMFKSLSKINTINSFQEFLQEINEIHFGYDQDTLLFHLTNFKQTEDKICLLGNKEPIIYSPYWTMYKNVSGTTIRITDIDQNEILLKDGDTARFEYNRLAKNLNNKDDIIREDFLDILERFNVE